jgi:hypothetical protein
MSVKTTIKADIQSLDIHEGEWINIWAVNAQIQIRVEDGKPIVLVVNKNIVTTFKEERQKIDERRKQ